MPDSYLYVVNNRMKEVMEVMTGITAFFVPLLCLAGFFGNNLSRPPVLQDASTGHTAF